MESLNIISSQCHQQLGWGAETPHQLVTSMSYSNLGSPTVAGEAPSHPIYHATSSQVLRMSDYIQDPFILEKAVLRIPVVVRRQARREITTR